MVLMRSCHSLQIPWTCLTFHVCLGTTNVLQCPCGIAIPGNAHLHSAVISPAALHLQPLAAQVLWTGSQSRRTGSQGQTSWSCVHRWVSLRRCGQGECERSVTGETVSEAVLVDAARSSEAMHICMAMQVEQLRCSAICVIWILVDCV
jgi:hypothetical protein